MTDISTTPPQNPGGTDSSSTNPTFESASAFGYTIEDLTGAAKGALATVSSYARTGLESGTVAVEFGTGAMITYHSGRALLDNVKAMWAKPSTIPSGLVKGALSFGMGVSGAILMHDAYLGASSIYAGDTSNTDGRMLQGMNYGFEQVGNLI